MSDLLVILGAGASHDALREGAERPPVAEDLFATRYDDLQSVYPGVDGLRDTILARMKQGQSLERILGRLAENPDLNIQRQMIEVPFYLQRLLDRFGTRTRRPGTYDTLITLIQEAQLSVTFVTLNYDTILDEAIATRYNSPIISIDDYVDISFSRKWNYIKLHGSVDWRYWTNLPVEEGPDEPSYFEQLRASGVSLGHATSELRTLTEPEDTRLPRARRPRVLSYPALAVPADGRKNIVCPDSHVEVLRETLRADPAILVIGNQGLDEDLMEILRDATKPDAPWWDRDLTVILRDAFRSEKPFLVVDPGETSKVAARFKKALNRSDLDEPWCSVGFREFVESEEAERFFKRVSDATASPKTSI